MVGVPPSSNQRFEMNTYKSFFLHAKDIYFSELIVLFGPEPVQKIFLINIGIY